MTSTRIVGRVGLVAAAALSASDYHCHANVGFPSIDLQTVTGQGGVQVVEALSLSAVKLRKIQKSKMENLQQGQQEQSPLLTKNVDTSDDVVPEDNVDQNNEVMCFGKTPEEFCWFSFTLLSIPLTGVFYGLAAKAYGYAQETDSTPVSLFFYVVAVVCCFLFYLSLSCVYESISNMWRKF